MTNKVTLTLRIPADGSMFDCELEALGEDLYRVVEVPGVFELEYFGYRDVLRLRQTADGDFDLVEVAKPGGWRLFDYVISQKLADSAELGKVLTRVQEAQGVWVRDFGGLVMIFLPPDCIWDPTRDLQSAMDACARK